MLDRRAFVGTVAAGSLAALGIATVSGCQPQPSQAWASPVALGPAVPADAPSPRGPGIAPYAMPSVSFAEPRDASPRRLLIVVDYQNDFVGGGPFGDIPTAKAIEDALAARVQEYCDSGDIVLYTMDTHPTDHYGDTREGQVNPEH